MTAHISLKRLNLVLNIAHLKINSTFPSEIIVIIIINSTFYKTNVDLDVDSCLHVKVHKPNPKVSGCIGTFL